jgi:hypothetical protein
MPWHLPPWLLSPSDRAFRRWRLEAGQLSLAQAEAGQLSLGGEEEG